MCPILSQLEGAFTVFFLCENRSSWTQNIIKGLTNVVVIHFHWEIWVLRTKLPLVNYSIIDRKDQ